jgi:hypothetical protein
MSLHATPPGIDKRISGLYLQQFRNDNLMYIVDPYAQMCFATTLTGSGIIEISCYALSLRPEWKPIIGWTTSEGGEPAGPGYRPR